MSVFSKISFLVLFSLLINGNVFAKSQIDSLKTVLKSFSEKKNDTLYHNTLREIVDNYRNRDVIKAIKYSNHGLSIAKFYQNNKELGYWYGKLGELYVLHDEHLLALEAYHNGLELALKNGENAAWWHLDIGNVYFLDNLNLNKAQRNYLLSIAEFKKFDDKNNGQKGIAVANNNLGLIQEERGKYEEAIKFYIKALDIRKTLNEKELIRHSYSLLANAYIQIDKKISQLYFDSVYNYVKGTNGEFNYYLDISELHRKTENYDEAIEEIKKAEKIAKTLNLNTFLPLVYKEYASIEVDKGNYSGAIQHAEIGLNYALEDKLYNYAIQLIEQLQEVYELQKDYKNAYSYQKMLDKTRESMHNAELKNAEINYELEENQKEVQFLKENLQTITQKEQALEDENERQQDFLLTFEWGFAIALLFGIFLFVSLRKQKKQKDVIAENHNEILSSIKYSKTIQQAILPRQDIFDYTFNSYFLISLPKDELSGDFYYLKLTSKHIIFALGDCTGHGVPGAMLSVLGTSFLNETIRREEVESPAEALEQMKYLVSGSFDSSTNKDGMDIALFTIKKDSNELTFAGAYISLYLLRNGEVNEILATKNSVALTLNDDEFTNKTLFLEKGDRVYVFSDGFTDQFGLDNDKLKKFSKKRLLKSIKNYSNLSMEVQKENLLSDLKNWRGEEEQTDDITMFAFEWN